jgi:hypothetical protein
MEKGFGEEDLRAARGGSVLSSERKCASKKQRGVDFIQMLKKW